MIKVQVSFAVVVSEIYPRPNIHRLHVYLEDSSSDEETPDMGPKIQTLMSGNFEEVKHQGFRDIRGRKSYSVNFVQNEEDRNSGMLTVEVVFKLNFTISFLFSICGERGRGQISAETSGAGGCP